jgi:hypothetical protein
MRYLPCPQLSQLHLKGVTVQLEPADGFPGVLHHCTSLTALELQHCSVKDTQAAATAIAAWSGLRSLILVDFSSVEHDASIAGELQLPLQLTHLSLDCSNVEPGGMAHLSKLSALLDLAHLKLTFPAYQGLPGGIPSQLLKLTCLDVSFETNGDMSEQLQDLSCFTAL